jgi:transposase
MNYVGVDLHKQTSWFYIVDDNGKKLDSTNVANCTEELKSYFEKIPKPFKLAVESTYNWYFFVDLAQQYAQEVFLANPYELKAFAKRHKKNDKIDAKLIATVLQQGYLPVVTIADKHTRQVRELLRYRIKLVGDRTRNISRLKGLLDKLGRSSSGDYTTLKHLKSIETEDLSPIYKYIIQKHIEQIIQLSTKIKEVEKHLDSFVQYDCDMSNLLTIRGIGPFSAALIKTEIIDVNRFKRFNKLCAYAGLAPRTLGSASRIYHGQLNINRRKNLQWILMENVFHYIKSSLKTQNKFNKIEKRKGYNTAKVVLARDMLKIIYHVLKEKRKYYKDKQQIKETIKLQSQSVVAAALHSD